MLNALPKSAQPGAKAALAQIWNAQDRAHAEAAVKVFAADYATKWPKAVAKITDDLDLLLAFYDSQLSMTARYTHVVSEMATEAAQRVGEALWGPLATTVAPSAPRSGHS